MTCVVFVSLPASPDIIITSVYLNLSAGSASNVFLDVPIVLSQNLVSIQKALDNYLLKELMSAFLGCMGCAMSPYDFYYY